MNWSHLECDTCWRGGAQELAWNTAWYQVKESRGESPKNPSRCWREEHRCPTSGGTNCRFLRPAGRFLYFNCCNQKRRRWCRRRRRRRRGRQREAFSRWRRLLIIPHFAIAFTLPFIEVFKNIFMTWLKDSDGCVIHPPFEVNFLIDLLPSRGLLVSGSFPGSGVRDRKSTLGQQVLATLLQSVQIPSARILREFFEDFCETLGG